MKVRMLQCMAGDRVVYNVGDVCEFDAEAAQRLIDAGFAEPSTGKVETAAVSPGERAVRKRGRPRKV